MSNGRTFAAIRGPQPMRGLGWRGNNLQFMADRVGYITMLYKRYGDIATFSINNPEQWFFAFGPKFNRQILTNIDLFQHINPIQLDPTTSSHRLTQGLLAFNGEKHRHHRSIMMPMFQKSQLTYYIPRMCTIVERFITKWENNEPRDINDDMRLLSIEILCDTTFDVEIDIRFVDLFRDWLTQFTSPFVALLPFNVPFSPLRRFQKLSEEIEAIINRLMAKTGKSTEQQDMLSLLCHLHDNGDLSKEEVVGEAMTLLVAGHETTATALSWILFLLSQHPTLLNAVTDEIRGLLGGSHPSVDQLDQMPLLERVIREGLRLLPPVPYQHRQATAPFDLGDYSLSAGTIVSYSPYITHRIPDLYKNPERFIPDRWIGRTASPYEYLPFGAGPRMCLGAAFAWLELKVILCILLQRWHMGLQPHAPIDRGKGIILAPRYGLPMIVQQPYSVHPLRAHQRRGNIWDSIEVV